MSVRMKLLPSRRPGGRRPGGDLTGQAALIGALLAGAVLTGCVGPGGAEPGGLKYDVPDPNPATYTFSDTTAFVVESGGAGALEVVTTRAGTAELQFRHDPPGYRVEVRFPRFRGTFENATQGAVTMDEREIRGLLVVRLGYRGDLVVVDTPALGARLREIVGPESLARPFFVHLPGRSAPVGARWVDTVVTRETGGGTVSRSTSVISSVLLGDTVVGERRLLRIRTAASSEVEVTGISGGVDIEQRLTGTVRGRVLWDQADAVLFERVEEGELTGTLSLPGTGARPMPVTARLRRTVSLRP